MGDRKRKKVLSKKEIGEKYWKKRKKNMLFVKKLLISWKKKTKDELVCVVCGERTQYALDTHHIDPNRNKKNYNSPENKVWICASCHRIMDKAKYPPEVENLFRKRHRKWKNRKEAARKAWKTMRRKR